MEIMKTGERKEEWLWILDQKNTSFVNNNCWVEASKFFQEWQEVTHNGHQ